MTDPVRVVVDNKDDRDTMVVILARNGYTVRQVKEKATGSTKNTTYVEFWKGGRG